MLKEFTSKCKIQVINKITGDCFEVLAYNVKSLDIPTPKKLPKVEVTLPFVWEFERFIVTGVGYENRSNN